MRQLTILIILTFAAVELTASRATPYPITISQPDGKQVTIRKFGDESFNYTTTNDGYTVARGGDGYLYYVDFTTGERQVTTARVGRPIAKGTILTKGVPEAFASRATSLRRATMTKGAKDATTKVKPTKILVIPAEFVDVKFKTNHTQSTFTRLLNEQEFGDEGATGSARDYFVANSMEAYTPNFVVSPIVTLPNTRAAYGSNNASGQDINPAQMVIDACREAAAKGVNFSEYDSDGDGEVDNVFIIYAGNDEASSGIEDAIWSHSWRVSTQVIINGKRLGNYACTAELFGNSPTQLCGIGTFCHEFGHVLGLSDLYDTNGQVGGLYEGFEHLSIMDFGNYNNQGHTPPYYLAIEREILGWLAIEPLGVEGNYTLSPIESNKAYKIPTTTPGEYFVIEYRPAVGWNSFQGASGVMIYHIDRSESSMGWGTALSQWTDNTVNATASHPCAKLIKAIDADAFTNPAKVLFPGSGAVKLFTAGSSPGAIAWDGTAALRGISEISIDGANAKFNVTAAQSIYNIVKVVGQRDAFLSWSSGGQNVIESWRVIYKPTVATDYDTITTSATRCHLAKINLYTPYDVRIVSFANGVAIDSISTTFQTAYHNNMGLAAIGGMKSSFKVGEVVYLMLLNVPQVPRSVVWKLDGAAVDDYQLTFSQPGIHTLAAVITYTTTNVETITRKIKIEE